MKRLHVSSAVPDLPANFPFHACAVDKAPRVADVEHAAAMPDQPRADFFASRRGGRFGLDQLGRRTHSPDALPAKRATLDAAWSGAAVDEDDAHCRCLTTPGTPSPTAEPATRGCCA